MHPIKKLTIMTQKIKQFDKMNQIQKRKPIHPSYSFARTEIYGIRNYGRGTKLRKLQKYTFPKVENYLPASIFLSAIFSRNFLNRMSTNFRKFLDAREQM